MDAQDPICYSELFSTKKGIFLLSKNYNATIKVWNAVSGEKIAAINDSISSDAASISADGTLLAARGNNTVFVWNLTTGKEMAR